MAGSCRQAWGSQPSRELVVASQQQRPHQLHLRPSRPPRLGFHPDHLASWTSWCPSTWSKVLYYPLPELGDWRHDWPPSLADPEGGLLQHRDTSWASSHERQLTAFADDDETQQTIRSHIGRRPPAGRPHPTPPSQDGAGPGSPTQGVLQRVPLLPARTSSPPTSSSALSDIGRGSVTASRAWTCCTLRSSQSLLAT